MNFGYNKVRPNFYYNNNVAKGKEVLACNPMSQRVVIGLDHLI